MRWRTKWNCEYLIMSVWVFRPWPSQDTAFINHDLSVTKFLNLVWSYSHISGLTFFFFWYTGRCLHKISVSSFKLWCVPHALNCKVNSSRCGLLDISRELWPRLFPNTSTKTEIATYIKSWLTFKASPLCCTIHTSSAYTPLIWHTHYHNCLKYTCWQEPILLFLVLLSWDAARVCSR